MQAYLILVRRELGSYFASFTGYVTMATILLLLGFGFVDLLSRLNAQPTDIPLTEVFYSTYYFWLILLLTSPVITMRVFAGEKASGTYETLMTAPVSDWQVVLAKFTGALLFYAVVWLPLLGYVWLVHRYASDPSALSLGTVGSTYLGILLIGSLFISLGCFASALSPSQFVAATVSYGLGLAFFVLSLRSLMGTSLSEWATRLFRYISMTEHMESFARGVIDTRPLVLYLSMTVLFLFLTSKVVESRRWK